MTCDRARREMAKTAFRPSGAKGLSRGRARQARPAAPLYLGARLAEHRSGMGGLGRPAGAVPTLTRSLLPASIAEMPFCARSPRSVHFARRARSFAPPFYVLLALVGQSVHILAAERKRTRGAIARCRATEGRPALTRGQHLEALPPRYTDGRYPAILSSLSSCTPAPIHTLPPLPWPPPAPPPESEKAGLTGSMPRPRL